MAQINENRDFKGIWIPKEIWLNKDLTLQEKVFLCEIDSLDNNDGCFASNLYFSDFFGLTKSRCSQIINNLQEKGLIDVTYQYKPGTKEVDKRIIKIRIKYIKGGIKYIKLGYLENAKDNNTFFSNKDICPSEEGPEESNSNKYKNIIDLYTNVCTDLPKVVKITSKRKTNMNKLLKEMSLEEIEKAFKIINNSPFCTGINDRNWKADFDFCIKSDKLTNALEGKYSIKPNNNGPNNNGPNNNQSKYKEL